MPRGRLTRMFDVSRRAAPSPGDGYAGCMYRSSLQEQAELVALLRLKPGGKRWHELTDAVLEHGSPALAHEALGAEGLFLSVDETVALEQARRDVEAWRSQGLEFWTILDDRYPAPLRDIHQAPPFLFARGSAVDGDVGVSVVGSREASEQGLQMARAIAEALVGIGVTVVAGLAAGIDTAAHVTALEGGGRTVAVIGTGINRQYPATNRELQSVIAERGLLLSQFWPDAPPTKHSFPMRNAVMSGYGVATIVVEAGEHSGARIQARLAVEHGRPVILTDLVVARTEWAKALEGRPGVHVASSTAEAISVVEQLANQPAEVDKILSMLVNV